jgi:hypothetical protein
VAIIQYQNKQVGIGKSVAKAAPFGSAPKINASLAGGAAKAQAAAHDIDRQTQKAIGDTLMRSADSMMRAGDAMDAVARVGEKLVSFGTRMYDTDQTNRMRDALALTSTEIQKKVQELGRDSDYMTYEKRYRAAVEELETKAAEGLTGPYAAEFQRQFLGQVTKGQVVLRGAAWKQQTLARAMGMEKTKTRLMNELAAGVDAGRVTDTYFKELEREKAAGFITDAEMKGARMEWQREVQAYQLTDLLARDPKKLLDLLNSKEEDARRAYDQIEPITIVKLKEKAEAEIEKLAHQKKGAYAAQVYDYLSSMGASAAQEWLTNPKKYGNFFKVMGVPEEDWLSVISMARTQVTARQVAVKTQQAEAQQKTDRAAIKEINGLLNAASSGKGLSGAVARLRELASGLSHSTYSALSKDLNDRIKDFQTADKARIDYKHSLSYNKVLSSVLGGKHDWTIDQMLDAGVAVDKVDALLNKQAEQSRTGYPNQINKAESDFKAMFKDDEDARLKLPAFRAEVIAAMEAEGLSPTDPKTGEIAQALLTKVEITQDGWFTSDYEGILANIQSDRDLPEVDPEVIRWAHKYLAVEEDSPQVEADDAMVDKKRAIALVVEELQRQDKSVSLRNIKAALHGNADYLTHAILQDSRWGGPGGLGVKNSAD